MQIGKNDKVTTFLMYDLDVEHLLPRLKSCQAELLLSNPNIELWFLLHSTDQHAELTSENAISLLQKSAPAWKNYKKGKFTEEQINLLWNKRLDAVKRAKVLTNLNNPSSGIYVLIEKLESAS